MPTVVCALTAEAVRAWLSPTARGFTLRHGSYGNEVRRTNRSGRGEVTAVHGAYGNALPLLLRESRTHGSPCTVVNGRLTLDVGESDSVTTLGAEVASEQNGEPFPIGTVGTYAVLTVVGDELGRCTNVRSGRGG